MGISCYSLKSTRQNFIQMRPACRHVQHFRSILPRFTPEALKANQALLKLLGIIGEKKKATPAQIALAWLLAQKPWIVPIPGTTKLHRLEENIGAVSVELTPDDLSEIDEAASKIRLVIRNGSRR